MLAVAQGDEAPTRQITLTGTSADGWAKGGQDRLFGVYDGTWCLEMAPEPEKTVLRAPGSHENQASDHADVVERLRKAAVDEIERRGADPDIVHWLRRGGEGNPRGWCRWFDRHPKPSGYMPYFMRSYAGK